MPTTTKPAPPYEIYDTRTETVAHNLERLAWLMDRAIPIPGTQLRVGLDAILGLFPGFGDFFCGLIQTGLVLVALKHYRVSKPVAARMAANVLIDMTLGSIPLVGDAFDAVFKANTRNLALLKQVRVDQQSGLPVSSASSIWYLVGIAAILLSALLIMLLGLAAITALVVKLVWNY